jgi:hypothetical protein
MGRVLSENFVLNMNFSRKVAEKTSGGDDFLSIGEKKWNGDRVD